MINENPIIELLAIKLYEHSHPEWYPRHPASVVGWLHLPEIERERYREMARGDRDLPGEEDTGPEKSREEMSPVLNGTLDA
jgi:hypothetical protein